VTSYRPASKSKRARDAIRSEGILPFARHASRWVTQYVAGLPATALPAFRRRRTFTVAGQTYDYLTHRYHYTWLNERAVEVPIVWGVLAEAGARRVLEVGNVLSHYGTVHHAVLDRYESAPGVINADVLEFEDEAGFDLIVSISTLEHVGWDERPRDPGAAERAFTHLVQLLAPGGTLVATLPVGHNPHLDQAIREGRLGLSELWALRRNERHNIWREVDPTEVWDAPYDALLWTAHGIVVCHARRAPDA
jgi:SAM-dependent methyltransferase